MHTFYCLLHVLTAHVKTSPCFSYHAARFSSCSTFFFACARFSPCSMFTGHANISSRCSTLVACTRFSHSPSFFTHISRCYTFFLCMCRIFSTHENVLHVVIQHALLFLPCSSNAHIFLFYVLLCCPHFLLSTCKFFTLFSNSCAFVSPSTFLLRVSLCFTLFHVFTTFLLLFLHNDLHFLQCVVLSGPLRIHHSHVKVFIVNLHVFLFHIFASHASVFLSCPHFFCACTRFFLRIRTFFSMPFLRTFIHTSPCFYCAFEQFSPCVSFSMYIPTEASVSRTNFIGKCG